MSYSHILDYWFGTLEGPEDYPSDKAPTWFQGGPEVDADITARFGDDVAKAAAGTYDSWAETPRGRLALVILCDQFTRNIHRGTAAMYDLDTKALRLVLEGIESGADRALHPVERIFLYMPFQHVEDVEIQRHGLKIFERLAASVPASIKEPIANFAKYAQMHLDVIEEFGRFPHRNEILGRETTAAEAAHLEAKGGF